MLQELLYNINRQAAKKKTAKKKKKGKKKNSITVNSGKIDKHEYLTGEEILRSNQRKIIQQSKFTSSGVGKALEKLTKKQVQILWHEKIEIY